MDAKPPKKTTRVSIDLPRAVALKLKARARKDGLLFSIYMEKLVLAAAGLAK